MNESQFNSEIVKSIESIKSDDYWAYKIPDLPGPTTKKPFDIVASIGGKSVAIESKFLKDYKRFGREIFRPHQFQALTKFSLSGGRTFLFLNIRTPTHSEYGYMNKLIIIDFKAMYSAFYSGQTITKTQLKMANYIPGKKGLFDLSDFCKSIEKEDDEFDFLLCVNGLDPGSIYKSVSTSYNAKR